MAYKIDSYISFFILVLFLILFQNVGKTFDDLRRSTFRTLGDFASGEAPKLSQAREGENIIEAQAREVIYLLRENRIEKYSVSKLIEKEYWYHRIVEGAWPIRISTQATTKIFSNIETLPTECKKIGASHGFVIASCP
ncbi:MAG: hypothetical protein M9962_04535 [Oligoflexia bacterium]|nr:hypothetical protein [Oligoflexia bacterium]